MSFCVSCPESSSRVSGVTEMSDDVAPKNPEQSMEEVSTELNGKKLLKRYDSLDLESSTVPGHHGHGSKVCTVIECKLLSTA